MEVERRLLITLDMMTSLLLAMFAELTTQAAIEHVADLSQCPRQCHHHGKCVAGSDDVLACRCHPGWGGDSCSETCTKSCENGKCIISGTRQTCQCTTGFHGDECEHPSYNLLPFFQMAVLLTQKWDKAMPLVKEPSKMIEQNIQRGSNMCSDNFRCQNGGKCKRGLVGGYRCECDISKHTGTFCHFTCPQSCLNGGKCIRLRKKDSNTGNGDGVTLQESEARYSCVCLNGFSGLRCQKDVRPALSNGNSSRR